MQPTAHDVAAYTLNRLGPMRAMKLEKLVYYGQAWHLAWVGAPLFAEAIEAWKGGPIVRALWNRHKGRDVVHKWNGNHEGNIVMHQQMAPSQVADYVGKDAAEKLLNAPLEHSETGRRQWRSIGGVDLKVGGDWAKALYDRAIPNFLNKYDKKWGAKVGETQLRDAVGVNERFDLTETPGGWRLVDKSQNEEQGTFIGPVFKTGGAAEKWLAEQGYLNQKVHSIDITPAMRKSVLQEGQPIARAEEPKSEYAVG